jgi:hypothetical protein
VRSARPVAASSSVATYCLLVGVAGAKLILHFATATPTTPLLAGAGSSRAGAAARRAAGRRARQRWGRNRARGALKAEEGITGARVRGRGARGKAAVCDALAVAA